MVSLLLNGISGFGIKTDALALKSQYKFRASEWFKTSTLKMKLKDQREL